MLAPIMGAQQRVFISAISGKVIPGGELIIGLHRASNIAFTELDQSRGRDEISQKAGYGSSTSKLIETRKRGKW
jgi:hypothetical protein